MLGGDDARSPPASAEGFYSDEMRRSAVTVRMGFACGEARIRRMTKRLWIETVGCQMNVLDSELVVAALRRQGWEMARTTAEADAVGRVETTPSAFAAGPVISWLMVFGTIIADFAATCGSAGPRGSHRGAALVRLRGAGPSTG